MSKKQSTNSQPVDLEYMLGPRGQHFGPLLEIEDPYVFDMRPGFELMKETPSFSKLSHDQKVNVTLQAIQNSNSISYLNLSYMKGIVALAYEFFREDKLKSPDFSDKLTKFYDETISKVERMISDEEDNGLNNLNNILKRFKGKLLLDLYFKKRCQRNPDLLKEAKGLFEDSLDCNDLSLEMRAWAYHDLAVVINSQSYSPDIGKTLKKRMLKESISNMWEAQKNLVWYIHSEELDDDKIEKTYRSLQSMERNIRNIEETIKNLGKNNHHRKPNKKEHGRRLKRRRKGHFKIRGNKLNVFLS
jgi:hypothetical protein